ncbi:MAG: ATP-binding cassette domain-containing protein [Streptosporangiales bacterium]|nr:ATP-binding cassette domain-containing protein [Streptosporangiales bacterium]
MATTELDDRPPATAQEPIVVDDVSHTFRAKGRAVHALSRVSLDIPSGEFVSLIGPSGCGKSTLLKVIAGLVAPEAGTITVGAARVDRPREEVSLAFQKPTLLRWRTALDNVLLPMAIRRQLGKDVRAYAMDLLKLVHLDGFERHYPKELSGGMEQRVAIARALVSKPSVLLMDVPFSALDEFTREELNDELLRIWQAEPKTVVFVTHNITEAVLLSDRVVVMQPRPGRIWESIPVELPRPRSAALRTDEAFYETVRTVRRSLDAARRLEEDGDNG